MNGRALALAALLGCGDDAGKDTSDSGDSGGSGTPDVPYDGWDWCPSASEAVASGDLELTVTDAALYCAVGNGDANGDDLAAELAKHVQVRVVPGTYALPSTDGTVDYALPVCLRGAEEDVPSAMAGTGTLTKQTSDFPWHAWGATQPLARDGEGWSFGFSLTAYPGTDDLPPLSLGDDLRGEEGETETFLWACRGECATDRRYVYPCDPRSPAEAATLTVAFDRGSLSAWVETVESFGPAVPAVFYRAEGTLDGVPFAQTDYWHLAHLPDHHNRGGGFLVRFPEPVGGACGLLAEVPSDDGSYRFERLRAATVGCDGAEIEELTGVVVE